MLLILLCTSPCIVGCQAESSLPVAKASTITQDPVKLFDGTSFEGWDGVNEFFRIEDEAIVAGSMLKPIPHNEFLCTVERFSNFRLTLEIMLLGGKATNSGIQFHTERIPNSKEVIGYQADIGEGYWGGLYDESRRNKMLATADPDLIDRVIKEEAWNNYVLETNGPNVRIAINGEQTISYVEEDPDIPLEGHICLQIHSGPPGELWFKKIMLEKLN